jgi:hypothetical protein
MNIRIMESPDIVLGWKAMLELEYGISGAVYTNRGAGGGVRAYFNLDDRVAAKIRGVSPSTEVEARAGVPAKPGRGSRTRLPKA